MEIRKLITALVLLELYRKGLISDAAQVPFLLQLLRFCSVKREKDSKEYLTKAWLEGYSSAIIGRSVFDLFLAKLWDLSSTEALFTFFENHKHALESEKGLRTCIHSRRDLKLSSRSPFGVIIRTGLQLFSSIKFSELSTLCASIIHFRESLARLCRSSQLARIKSSSTGVGENAWLVRKGINVFSVVIERHSAAKKSCIHQSSVNSNALFRRVLCSGNYNGAVENCMTMEGCCLSLANITSDTPMLQTSAPLYFSQIIVDTFFDCRTNARLLFHESISATHASAVPLTVSFPAHAHEHSLSRTRASRNECHSLSAPLAPRLPSLLESISAQYSRVPCLRFYLFDRHGQAFPPSNNSFHMGRIRMHQRTDFRFKYPMRMFDNLAISNHLLVATHSIDTAVNCNTAEFVISQILRPNVLLILRKFPTACSQQRLTIDCDLTRILIILSLVLCRYGEFDASREMLESLMPVLMENTNSVLHGGIFSQIADCLLGACKYSDNKRSKINKCLDMLDRAAYAYAQAGNIKARLQILSKKARLLNHMRERAVRNRTLQMWRHINRSFNSPMPLPSNWI